LATRKVFSFGNVACVLGNHGWIVFDSSAITKLLRDPLWPSKISRSASCSQFFLRFYVIMEIPDLSPDIFQKSPLPTFAVVRLEKASLSFSSGSSFMSGVLSELYDVRLIRGFPSSSLEYPTAHIASALPHLLLWWSNRSWSRGNTFKGKEARRLALLMCSEGEYNERWRCDEYRRKGRALRRHQARANPSLAAECTATPPNGGRPISLFRRSFEFVNSGSGGDYVILRSGL